MHYLFYINIARAIIDIIYELFYIIEDNIYNGSSDIYIKKIMHL